MCTMLQKCITRETLKKAVSSMVVSKCYVSRKVVFKPPVAKEPDKTALNVRSGKGIALSKVEELLGIRKYTALELVTKNKKLWQTPESKMDENHKICLENGIKNATFIKYIDLLTQEDLRIKIGLVKRLPYDINESAPLATISLLHLQKLLDSDSVVSSTLSRIEIMKRLLEASTEVICLAFVQRSFVRSMNLKRMEQNVVNLKRHGITNEEIINDFWVLEYSTSTVDMRVDLARRNNIEKIKTWMIRCQLDIFNNYVKRRSENKQILGDNTLAEYLSERLECSLDQAKVMTQRLPALKNKNMTKLQEIIAFLYSEGFKPSHICRVPKILLHSVTTMRKRIRELGKQGLQMDSLHMLTKSQRQYLQYYETLVKGNKNKVKCKDGN